MVKQFLWPVELKCLSTGKPGLLFRILRQCSLNPSGFTNINNGRTSMTGHAVCKITRLAGKMALGGSPLTMTDVQVSFLGFDRVCMLRHVIVKRYDGSASRLIEY